MAVKVKIEHLEPGTVFNAGPVAVKILEHFPDGTTLVITDECIANRPFTCQPFKPDRPPGWTANDWRTSTLRADLNRDFLSSFDKAGGPIRSKNIILATWDLADSAGDGSYGIVVDKIGLLTKDMFEKYSEQGLLGLDDCWWLCTPYDAGHPYGVRFVDADGNLNHSISYYCYRGVRPAFRVESGVEVEMEDDEVNLTPSAPLEGFTTQQLIEEVLRRVAAR